MDQGFHAPYLQVKKDIRHQYGDEVQHNFDVPEETDNPGEHLVEARLPGGRTTIRVDFVARAQ